MEMDSQCPFLVPVLADLAWVFPTPAYCRPRNDLVKVPANATLARRCTTADHAKCPGYQQSLIGTVGLVWGERVLEDSSRA
jgi:hypothetical protein